MKRVLRVRCKMCKELWHAASTGGLRKRILYFLTRSDGPVEEKTSNVMVSCILYIFTSTGIEHSDHRLATKGLDAIFSSAQEVDCTLVTIQ